MTLVVGVNLGLYAMIAADSRETVLFPDKEPEEREDYKKVRITPTGLAAGAGITAAVFGAIDDLSANYAAEISDPDFITDYLRAFNENFVRAASENPSAAPIKPLLGQVAWMFSSVRRGRVGVTVFYAQFNFKPMSLHEGQPASILPIDMTPEASGPAEHALRAALRVCRRPREIDASLEHNMAALGNYFKQQREVSNVLGTGIQVGYHTRGGQIDVTDILPLSDL